MTTGLHARCLRPASTRSRAPTRSFAFGQKRSRPRPRAPLSPPWALGTRRSLRHHPREMAAHGAARFLRQRAARAWRRHWRPDRHPKMQSLEMFQLRSPFVRWCDGGVRAAAAAPAGHGPPPRLHFKFLLQPKSVIIFLKGQEKLHTMGPPAPAYTRARRPPARSPCASRLPQRQRPPSPSRA